MRMEGYTKIELEFLIKSSAKVIYNFLATPGGLAEWFADNVVINKDHTLTFTWGDNQQSVRILSKKNDESIKMQWTDVISPNIYFEMAISKNTYGSGIALIVTDFPENDEIEEITMLWEKQIQKLTRKIGG